MSINQYGKKVIKATINKGTKTPKPNQIVNKGAIAIIGVTFKKILIGNTILPIVLYKTIKIARKTATKAPITNPAIATNKVILLWTIKKTISSNNLSTIFKGDGTI